MKIRSKSIAYGSMKKKQCLEEENTLIKEIETNLEALRQNQDDNSIIEENNYAGKFWYQNDKHVS